MIRKLLFDRTTVPDLERSLDVYSARQKVISNNIANVNTPCFRAKKVTFEEEYRRHLEKPALKGRLTDSGHRALGVRDLHQIHPRIRRADNTRNDSGINNVDIDKEMAELAKNSLRYQQSVALIRKKFLNLRAAVKGRG